MCFVLFKYIATLVHRHIASAPYQQSGDKQIAEIVINKYIHLRKQGSDLFDALIIFYIICIFSEKQNL